MVLTPTDIVWLLVVGWIAVSSAVGFFIMGADKSRARYHERRIPERVLFEIAFIGGAFGVVAGSSVFHHKTLKHSFGDIAYVTAVAWLVVLLVLSHLLGAPTY